jgi:hypothetical protein
MPNSKYVLIQNPNMTFSLKNLEINENMHSNIGPVDEALKLYIEQSNLKQIFITETKEIIIHDVGLGAGANACMTLQVLKALKNLKNPNLEVIIYSFENDLLGFELALANKDKLPYFKDLEQICKTL